MYVFEPTSPALVFSKLLPVSKNDRVAAAVLVPNSFSSDTRLNWHDRTDLYFITSKNVSFNSFPKLWLTFMSLGTISVE